MTKVAADTRDARHRGRGGWTPLDGTFKEAASRLRDIQSQSERLRVA